MATLQASLLCRTSLPFSSHHPQLYKLHPHSFNFLSPCKMFQPRLHSSVSRSVASRSQSNPSGADSSVIENEATPSVVDAESSDPSIGEEKSESAKEEERLPIVALYEGARESVEKAFADFMTWLPLWQQERRLARLIVDAEANPNDVAKQTTLLIELNKHRFELN